MPKLKPSVLLLASSGRISAPSLLALRPRVELRLIERAEFRPLNWREAPPDLAIVQFGARGHLRGLALLDELAAWDPLLPLVALLGPDLSVDERRLAVARPLFAHIDERAEAWELRAVIARAISFGRLLMEREQHWEGLLEEALPLALAEVEPRLLQEIASGDAHVALQGGTEATQLPLARVLHRFSRRSRGPFLVFRPAGLGEAACRSRLFGAGAASAAACRGLLPAAAGGSLVIVGAMGLPRPLQGELELALAESAADARLTLLVDEDLETAVAENRFHRGLFRRLAPRSLRLPRLDEPTAGVGALHADADRRPPRDFGRETDGAGSLPLDYKEAKRQVDAQFRQRFFEKVLRLSGGSVTGAAKICGLPRSSLSTMLKNAGVKSDGFRAAGRNGNHG